MSENLNQGLDATQKQLFEDTLFGMAQQSESKFVTSGAITFVASDGRTNNMGRIGKIELVEVTGRNPKKQKIDYAVDNRMFSKKRFTATIVVDKLKDINETIVDPTSDLMVQMNKAKNRVIDRFVASIALGTVLVGAPDGTSATTSVTAANDGVLTVNATAGLTYAKIQEITQNYVNNELDMSEFKGSVFGITGKENTALMGLAEFINNDYINAKPLAGGVASSVAFFNIALFAGSVNGGITVANPVLAEGATDRDCLVMAPDSLRMYTEIAKFKVEESADLVNSDEITIDFWIGGMRTEGARIQKLTTTI